MKNYCLNHRNLTYDFCYHCKNQSTRCPEYLSDVHTRQTKPNENSLFSSASDSPPIREKDKTAESYNLATCCNEGTK